MSKKVNIAIIGTGNIGTDLLIKIMRSKILRCSVFAGQNIYSAGIKKAKKIGVNTTFSSINYIINNPDCADIVFDATSADMHFKHAPVLKKMKKFTVDMTPSRIGKMCVPVLNLEECLNYLNVNMVTCGGQSMAPLAKVIMEVHPDTKYMEIVSSISSKSAGMGTRNNIDQYTQTTGESLKTFSNVPKSKAIIILNPAEPPIIMHNTLFAEIPKPNLKLLKQKINKMVGRIKEYVPGYKLVLEPVIEGGRVTLANEVVGRGDYLPVFAGNLDMINSAAIVVAEEYAQRKILR